MSEPLRIAVCSSDGRMIDEHFGTTPQFLVLDLENGIPKFIEKRQNRPACHDSGHAGDAMANSIDLISDCQILFTARAGPPVLARLAQKGIRVVQLTTSISEAVAGLRQGMTTPK